jgi:putative molybdenum carrier protein
VLARIVSGGQTGVDRAALDVALELGLPCGGWCPRGRRAEDGPIAERYPLQETPAAEYEQRTEWNVRDSDATLVLTSGVPSGGTALTVRAARRLGRPVLVVDPTAADAAEQIRAWLLEAGVRTLNVAGPRESGAPGIHRSARVVLRAALT